MRKTREGGVHTSMVATFVTRYSFAYCDTADSVYTCSVFSCAKWGTILTKYTLCILHFFSQRANADVDSVLACGMSLAKSQNRSGTLGRIQRVNNAPETSQLFPFWWTYSSKWSSQVNDRSLGNFILFTGFEGKRSTFIEKLMKYLGFRSLYIQGREHHIWMRIKWATEIISLFFYSGSFLQDSFL